MNALKTIIAISAITVVTLIAKPSILKNIRSNYSKTFLNLQTTEDYSVIAIDPQGYEHIVINDKEGK